MVILYQIETLRMYDRHILYCNGLGKWEREKRIRIVEKQRSISGKFVETNNIENFYLKSVDAI